MDRARDDVLARPRLALQHHGDVGRRDALQNAENLSHCEALADHLAETVRLGRQQLGPRVPRHEAQLNLAHAEHVAGLEIGVCHPRAADVTAVRGSAVTQTVCVALATNLGVYATDGVIGQYDVAASRLADGDRLGQHVDLATAKLAGQHQESVAVVAQGIRFGLNRGHLCGMGFRVRHCPLRYQDRRAWGRCPAVTWAVDTQTPRRPKARDR